MSVDHTSGKNSDENIETRKEEESSRTSEISEGETEEGNGKNIPERVDERSNDSQESSLSTENNSKSRNLSEDERRFKNIFARPLYAEPRHPIFSSPFCRHICPLAFGPKKPKWYHSLSTEKLYIFKDIINYVVVGRSGQFKFDDFLKSLQDFDPTITRSEVVEILQELETSEFEELDFGKFLFLLAYKNQAHTEDDHENIEASLSATPITPRQSLILSAISYFTLIASLEDIERYYIENTRRKATVLHHHMEATRLRGLTEMQMEIKQRNASKNLGLLYFFTGSPYALPVPFVPRFTKGKLYQEWKRSKYSIKPDDKFSVKFQPAVLMREKGELGERLKDRKERGKTVSAMTYGRIPLPEIRFPSKIRNQLKAGGFTVELKDYLMEKAKEGKQEFRKRLKEAAVLCAYHNLRPLLCQGFPTKTDGDQFLEIYKRYFPLKESEVKNYSLWVKPVGYQVSHSVRPLYPDKIAFGRKV